MDQAITLRLAKHSDAEAIREIYNAEVTGATSTFDLIPRSTEQQREWINERSGAFSAVVTVETATGKVVGFGSLSPYRSRAAYRTSVEDSVYVHRDQLGRGIGGLLLARLVETARSSGFHTVLARIEASSTASRALHESCGFELVGIERQVGRKFQRWLDVAIMQRML